MLSLVPFRDRSFEQIVSDFERIFDSTHSTFYVPLGFSEVDDKYTLSLDVPGMIKEDLSIDLDNGVATISGKSDRNGRHREIYQRLRIPQGVDMEKSSATVENGVLTITLSKSESAQKRKLLIT